MVFLTLLLATAGLIEIHALAGAASPEVLASLWQGSVRWFGTPAIAHIAAALVLLGLAVVCARRSAIRRWWATPLHTTAARRGKWATTGVLAIVFVWLVGVELDEIGRVISRPTDFGAFYNAAGAVARGLDPYATTENAYFYPPTFAHVLRPLTWLPPGGASVLWLVLKMWLLMRAAEMGMALLDHDRLCEGRRIGLLFGMLAASARFWTSDLQFGNSNIVILVLVLATLHYDRTDRPRLAGIWLAAAATIKLAPVIVGVHLLSRARWRAIGWAIAALVVLNGLPFFGGAEDVAAQWHAWADAGVEQKLTDNLAQPDNQSLWGFLGRAFPDGGGNRAVWAVASLLLMAAAAVLSRRAQGAGDDARMFARALYPGLVLVVSPGSWVVHYVGVMLPLGAILRGALGPTVLGRAHLAVFALAGFTLSMSGWWRWSIGMSIEQSWYLVTLLLMLVVMALSIAHLTRPGPDGHRGDA